MYTLFTAIGCLLAIGASAQNVARQQHLSLAYRPNQQYIEQAAETIEATSKIPSEANVEYLAGKNILLQPGFMASAGANFIAHIKSDSNASLEVRAYPNPFSEFTTIEFTLFKAGSVSLLIIDEKGQIVDQLLRNSSQEAGKHQLEWRPKPLLPGVYIPLLNTDQHHTTTRLIKK